MFNFWLANKMIQWWRRKTGNILIREIHQRNISPNAESLSSQQLRDNEAFLPFFAQKVYTCFVMWNHSRNLLAFNFYNAVNYAYDPGMRDEKWT